MKFILFIICFIFIVFFSSSFNENFQTILSNLYSLLFVLGGTLIATLISFPLDKIKRIRGVLKASFSIEKFDFSELTRQIINITREYKRLGFKSLEEASNDIKNPYLKLGFKLIADGCTWEQIRTTIEKEVIFDNLENDNAQRILRSMSKYAPAFGLIGTIIGLMKIFPQLSNPVNIGSAISLALLTTLYGVLFSNIIFLPLANKLNDNSSENELICRFILEALLCIEKREYAVVIDQKLSALMPKHELLKYQTHKIEHLHIQMAENS